MKTRSQRRLSSAPLLSAPSTPPLPVSKVKREVKLESNDDESKSGKQGVRAERSLNVLTRQFMRMLDETPDGEIDIREAVREMKVNCCLSARLGPDTSSYLILTKQVAKRRIYDITGVMEGIGAIVKTRSSHFRRSIDTSHDESRLRLQIDAMQVGLRSHFFCSVLWKLP